METHTIKHHVTGKEIAGYGIKDLVRNYNAHTAQQTSETYMFDENIDSFPALRDQIQALISLNAEIAENDEPQVKTVRKSPAKKRKR